MVTGISTASLFSRFFTEEAAGELSAAGVASAEVFLESYREYNAEFAREVKARAGNMRIHSVHTLTTQFEPQLYSLNVRAQEDSFSLLERAMTAAEILGAEYYTFHGGARFKKTPMVIDFDRVGAITERIIEVCAAHNVSLAYENVHWGYYNYIGFFKELKKRAPRLKGTLDIKQARQSGIFYGDFIDEMKGSIVTAHISDVDENGKMCLPGRGVTDFNEVFSRLNDAGFNGAVLLEVYPSDFKTLSELYDSYGYITALAEKVFGKAEFSRK